MKRFLKIIGALLVMTNAAFAQENIDPANIMNMVEAGRYEEARATLITVSRNPLDILLLEVEIARAEGRIGDAIDLLDQLLAVVPNYAVARTKLAVLLFQDKQYDRARYQLEWLRNRSGDEETRAYFAKQLEVIDDIQPFSFGMQFAIIPSNNINNGHEDPEYCYNFGALSFCDEYPPELQAQSGLKMQLSNNASYRWNFADQHGLEIGLNTQINHYTVDTLENQTARLSLQYIYQDANDTFTIGPFLSHYWGDGKTYSNNLSTGEADLVYENENYQTRGFTIGYSHIIDSQNRVRFNASHSKTKYEDADRGDSYRNSYGLRYSYALDARRAWNFDLGTSVYKQNSTGDWISSANYRSVNFGVDYDHLFENNWFASLGVSVEAENHFDRLYPFSNSYRQDKIYGLEVEIRNQDWKVLDSVPSLNCNYNKTVSNIEDRSFSAISCGVFFTNQY